MTDVMESVADTSEQSNQSDEKTTLAPPKIRIEDVIRATCVYFWETLGRGYRARNLLLSEDRSRSIVRPRQIAMFLAKTHTTRSLPEIGRRFGGRDHTTVLHSIRKIELLIATGDQATIDAMQSINDLLHRAECAVTTESKSADETSSSPETLATESFRSRQLTPSAHDIVEAVKSTRLHLEESAAEESAEWDRALLCILAERHLKDPFSIDGSLGGKPMQHFKYLRRGERLFQADSTFALAFVYAEHQLGITEWGMRR